MDLGPGAQFPALMPRRDDPQIGLGKAIRALRQEGKLSQETLGHRADIHPKYCDACFTGDYPTTLTDQDELAPPPDQFALLEERVG